MLRTAVTGIHTLGSTAFAHANRFSNNWRLHGGVWICSEHRAERFDCKLGLAQAGRRKSIENFGLHSCLGSENTHRQKRRVHEGNCWQQKDQSTQDPDHLQQPTAHQPTARKKEMGKKFNYARTKLHLLSTGTDLHQHLRSNTTSAL